MKTVRMTRKELDYRVQRAMQEQPKYAANSNFHLGGWDAAKVAPTVKAVLIEFGFIEIIDNPNQDS